MTPSRALHGTPLRVHVALQDIWAQGLQSAGAEQREYTEAEYLRQLDGLTYDEIVTLEDPTGKITKERYRAGVAKMLARSRQASERRSQLRSLADFFVFHRLI